jgi:hypothetical protein
LFAQKNTSPRLQQRHYYGKDALLQGFNTQKPCF